MVCVKPPEAFPVYHRVPQLFNQHSIEGLRKSIKNVIAFVNIVFPILMKVMMLLVFDINMLYILISLSNIYPNSNLAHLRYSPRLTIRYWCPAEWISTHIQTDITQIPSVICLSTEKYQLEEPSSVKICVTPTLQDFLQL